MMATTETSVGMFMSEELKQKIDKHRARIGLENEGQTPSRSEWLREAARQRLDNEQQGNVGQTAEA